MTATSPPSFEADLNARINAAENLAEMRLVARDLIDQALAGSIPAMVAIIEAVDGPAEVH